MNSFYIAANMGALATLALGCLGLFTPLKAAAFTRMSPIGKMGLSEIRATYGGLFFALGGVALYMQTSLVFVTLGAAWMGAAIGRLFSVAVDQSSEIDNIFAIVFECVIGALCLCALGV